MRIAQVVSHAGVNSANWTLFGGSGFRKSVYFVHFGTVFRRPPKVSVSLKAFDIIRGTNHRLNVEVERVFNNGVEIAFTTWADTSVYSAGVTAIAIGKAPKSNKPKPNTDLPENLAPILDQNEFSTDLQSNPD